MVSDEELVNRLLEILRESDLDVTTPGSLRRQLESDFGVDLSDRKAFVREQIDLFLQSLKQEDEEKEADEEDDDVEEDGTGPENEGVEDDEEGNGGDEEEEHEKENIGSSKAVKKIKKRGVGGFAMLCSLSPRLQALFGVPELARTEVVKRLWMYIRDNNLQDPKNKRNILCDEALRALFGVSTINMFKMNKVLSKHIWPLSQGDGTGKQKVEDEGSNDSVPEEKNAEEEEGDAEEEVEEQKKERSKKRQSKKVDKDVKKRSGGFNKLCSLSPQLQEFVGAPALARTEVVKRLWVYIRENNLQDPSDKRKILCDESLRQLFNVESIDMFQMSKALSKHIWPLNGEEGIAYGSSRNEVQQKQGRVEDSDEPKQKEKQQKKGGDSSSQNEVQQKQGREEDSDESNPKEKLQKKGADSSSQNEVRQKQGREEDSDEPKQKEKQQKKGGDSSSQIEGQQKRGREDSDEPKRKEKQQKKGADSSSQNEVQQKQGREEDSDEPKQNEKQQKKGASGLLAPLQISDAFVSFLGTGETTLSRSGAVKRMWEYIKKNGLQDPADKRRIICDDKLKELFEVDSFNGFSVSKLLNAHFINLNVKNP